MSNFIVNFEQNTSLVADALGLNSWELQTASFNGVSFFIVPASWQSFNPFQPLTKTAINYFDPSSDPNQNLSFDTKLTLENIKDFQTKKLSIRRMPNFDGFFIRDNGSDGKTYEMVGLLIGPDYLTALQNIQDTLSEQKGLGSTFVHPVYGALQNCYVASFATLFNSTEWRAATFTMRIVQSGSTSSKIITPSLSSIAANVLNLITGSIAAFGVLAADIQLAQGFLGRMGVGSYGGQTITATPAQRAQQLSNSVASNQAKLQAATTLVYQQLVESKLGVTNYTYMNSPVDYNNLPSLFGYSTVRIQQFSSLLQYYADSIGQTIQLYRFYGVDTIWSDNITLLKTSLVQLDTLLSTVLSQVDNSYVRYTLPSNYSVRQIFFYNGLDFNNWNLVQTFIDQNYDVISDVNVITKGSVVSLPVAKS